MQTTTERSVIYLPWLLTNRRGHCCPQINSGPPGPQIWLGDPGSEGGPGDDHPGLGRVRRVRKVGGGAGAGAGGRVGARVRVGCCLLPLLPGGGRCCHGKGLLSDLLHDGLHELWGQAWDMNWRSGPYRGTERRTSL